MASTDQSAQQWCLQFSSADYNLVQRILLPPCSDCSSSGCLLPAQTIRVFCFALEQLCFFQFPALLLQRNWQIRNITDKQRGKIGVVLEVSFIYQNFIQDNAVVVFVIFLYNSLVNSTKGWMNTAFTLVHQRFTTSKKRNIVLKQTADDTESGVCKKFRKTDLKYMSSSRNSTTIQEHCICWQQKSEEAHNTQGNVALWLMGFPNFKRIVE